MSERARAYYEARATRLAVPLPAILDGVPEQILHAHTTPTSEGLAVNFAGYAEETEPFVMQGVRYVHDLDRPEYSDEEWQRVITLPRYGKIFTATQYAAGRIARHLITTPARGNIIYLEALAQDEIPPLTVRYATTNKPLARSLSQEMARVVLLSRAVTPSGDTAAAYLTVLWARRKDSLFGVQQREASFLTPYYLGWPVFEKEMAMLPPLELG